MSYSVVITRSVQRFMVTVIEDGALFSYTAQTITVSLLIPWYTVAKMGHCFYICEHEMDQTYNDYEL